MPRPATTPHFRSSALVAAWSRIRDQASVRDHHRDHVSGVAMSGWLVAGAVVVTVPVYWVACMLWPFTDCRKCGGSGRRSSPLRKNYGRCRRCKGRGERLRLGRRVINWITSAKSKAVG